jgi:hypothetical protein
MFLFHVVHFSPSPTEQKLLSITTTTFEHKSVVLDAKRQIITMQILTLNPGKYNKLRRTVGAILPLTSLPANAIIRRS